AHRLPIPKTLIAPMTFDLPFLDGDPFISRIKASFSYPFIIKEAFGSFGEQVYLIKNEKELINRLDALKNRPFLVQQFIASSFGQDIRLQVIGDEVVTAMKRTALDDFRANVTAGGTMEPYTASPEEKRI